MHSYTATFCKSVAGGFAGIVVVDKSPDSAQGSPRMAYVLVQGDDWPTFEERLRRSVNFHERLMRQNRMPIRINLERTDNWPAEIISSANWARILDHVETPFAPSRPVPGLGKISLVADNDGFRLRWLLISITVVGVAESPKPELVAKLLRILDDHTDPSVQLNGQSFPVSKTELLAEIFEDMESPR